MLYKRKDVTRLFFTNEYGSKLEHVVRIKDKPLYVMYYHVRGFDLIGWEKV